ncbi:MAG: IS630 family transposase [Microcystaceae cyanobacterium]
MPSLSLDLRKRIIETYEKGNTSIRKVAQQFQVSKTTVNNLIQLKRATGEIAPKPPNGGKPSRLLGKEAEAIDMVEQHPDYTLLEYCELWRERTDIDIAPSTMCSFLKTLKLTRKKKTKRNHRASREEVQQERMDYWQLILQEDVKNLVFLDEMGILLGIMRDMARSLVGTRAYDLNCVYRGKRLNYIGAMSLKGVLSVKRLPKSLDGESFKEYLKEELLPKLEEGSVLVSDNLKAHKVEGVEEMLKSAGMKMVYLSRYSPDFNPIEHLWWEIKAFIRRFRPKTEVEKLIKIALLLHTPKMTKNYFTYCCYCAT